MVPHPLPSPPSPFPALLHGTARHDTQCPVSHGEVYALNAFTGKLLWSYETASIVAATVGVDRFGSLYVMSFEGVLHAVSLHGDMICTWLAVLVFAAGISAGGDVPAGGAAVATDGGSESGGGTVTTYAGSGRGAAACACAFVRLTRDTHH